MLQGGIAGKIGKTDMARLARVIALEVAHHVTQRGNARGFILNRDADREVYLGLFKREHGTGGCRCAGILLDVEPCSPGDRSPSN